MTFPELERAVAAHPFTRDMSSAHQRLLAESAVFARFDAGQIVFHEGDVANRFYLIEQGRMTLETRMDEEDSITVHTAGAGEAVGFSWILPPYYWQFTACALEPCLTMVFYGSRLRECCEQDREFGFDLLKRVMAVLTQRLEASLQECLRLANPSPQQPGSSPIV